MTKLITLSLLLLLPTLAFAQGHKHPERWYQQKWCAARGQMEIIMPDGSRADCANATHIVEFDFGKKWAESIGQALNYGAQSGKVPCVVLILERPGDERYLERVKNVRAAHGLNLEAWAVDADGRELP